MTKNQNDTITRINQTFDYNIQLINKIKDQSIDAAVVFSVTLMETILSEFFFFSNNRWFDHCRSPGEIPIPILNTPSARNDLRKYLKDIRLLDDFFEMRYIYENTSTPDLLALNELLVKRINFQSLKSDDNRGAVKAYQIFLGINLDQCLAFNKKESKAKWLILKQLVDARHGIIHRGKKSDIELSQIEMVLSSLKYLKNDLSEKLCVAYVNP